MPELSRLAAGVGESATMAAANAATNHPRPINMAVGEPGELPASQVLAAASRAIDAGLVRYGPPAGIPELRDAVAARVARKTGLDWSADEVIITSGGKPAILDAMRCLLDAGDEVIVLAPYWPTFIQQIEWCGARPVACSPGPDLLPDLQAIRQAVTNKTRAIVVNSPVNPTSLVLDEATIRGIAEVAVANDLWIIADCVYGELAFCGEAPSILTAAPECRSRTIMVESFSKTFSMTGMRLGSAAAPKEIVQAMAGLISASSSHPSMPAQYAGIEALKMDGSWIAEQREHYRKRAEFVVGALRAMDGVEVETPQAAFYVFPDINAWLKRNGGMSDATFCSHLLQEVGLRLVPGTAFGMPGHLRVSCGLKIPELKDAMQRLGAFLAAEGETKAAEASS